MDWYGSGASSWTTNGVACYDYAQLVFDYNSAPFMYDTAGFPLGQWSLGSGATPLGGYITDWIAGQNTVFQGFMQSLGHLYTRAMCVKVSFKFRFECGNPTASNNYCIFIGGLSDGQSSLTTGLTPPANGAYAFIPQCRGFKMKRMGAKIIQNVAAPGALSISKSFKPTYYVPLYWKDPSLFQSKTGATVGSWTYPTRPGFGVVAGICTKDGTNFTINSNLGKVFYWWKMRVLFTDPVISANTPQ